MKNNILAVDSNKNYYKINLSSTEQINYIIIFHIGQLD